MTSTDLKSSFHKLPKKMLEFLLPSRCLSCGHKVEQQGLICSDCWKDLIFITSPKCPSCCLPYPFEIEKEMICPDCARKTYEFDKAISVLYYNDISRKMLLGFKHSDKTFMAPYFAKLIYKAAKNLTNQADLILPVPLHSSKLRLRRYNQAALLAQELAKISGLPFNLTDFMRSKNTQTQGEKTREQRFSNVQNAFSFSATKKHLIKGKDILLVDDVMTTGATFSSCAKALKKSGAAKIFAVSLARVVQN